MSIFFNIILSFFALTPLFAFANDATLQADPQMLEEATKAADSWLSTLDNGRFDKSWSDASLQLQLTMPQDQWKLYMDKVRAPLSKPQKRVLADVRTATDPKGLPQGQYMVVIYKSSFPSKPNAIEFLTLVKESDGHWRILTYMVR